MRVHGEYAGWMLEEPKTVWIKGRRLTDEAFPLIGYEVIKRTLFMINESPRWVIPVPVPVIQPQGIKARWLYLWKQGGIAGVAFMLGEEESRLITPVPVEALKEVCDGD